MMRGLATVAGGTALLVAGLTGCSNGTRSPSAPSSVATASSGSVSASTGTGTAKVTIDGQVSDIKGEVVCAANGGNFTIASGVDMTNPLEPITKPFEIDVTCP